MDTAVPTERLRLRLSCIFRKECGTCSRNPVIHAPVHSVTRTKVGGQKQRTGYQTGVTQPEKYPFARFYLQARQQQGRRLKTHACEARHDRPHRNTAHLPDESGGRNGRFQRRLAGSAPRRNDGSQQGPAHSAYGGG